MPPDATPRRPEQAALRQPPAHTTISLMTPRQAPLLDMTPDGQFRPTGFRAPGFNGNSLRLPWPTRVFLIAVGVSMVAAVIAGAALLIYLALLLIPLALGLIAIGYISLRIQAWRAGRGRAVIRS